MCIMAICFSALFISCSKDNTENSDQQSKKYRLIKKVYDDGYMVNYYYNVNGQLRKISDSHGGFEEFYYDNDNKLTKILTDTWLEEYYYKNGLLDFIAFSSDTHIELPDTVFFMYNNKSLISHMVSSYSYNETTKRITDEFSYDNENRLITKIQIQLNNLSPEYDSLIYKWNSLDNLIEMRHVYNYSFDGVMYHVALNQENYEYNSYLNYSGTIPYHQSYLIRLKYLEDMDEKNSNNNVIEIRHKTEYAGYTRLYNVTESENGLPKRIEGEYSSWNLTYEPI